MSNINYIDKLSVYLFLYDSHFLTFAKHKLNMPENYKELVVNYEGVRENSKKNFVNVCFLNFLNFFKEEINIEQALEEVDEPKKIILQHYKVLLDSMSWSIDKIDIREDYKEKCILNTKEAMSIIGVYMKLFNVKFESEDYVDEEKDYFEWLHKCSVLGKKLLSQEQSLEEYYRQKKYELLNLQKDFILYCTYLSDNRIEFNKRLTIYDLKKDKEYLMKYLSKEGKEKLDNPLLEEELIKRQDEYIDYQWLMLKINSVSWSIIDIAKTIFKSDFFKENEDFEAIERTLTRYLMEFMTKRYDTISGFVFYMSIKEDFFKRHLLALYRFEQI